jgi:catechol 2,3-dioxygenase-like lactoylglutathione lyase family enzyme
MLDHMGFSVSDYERSKAFYEKALAPLGLKLLMEPVPGIGGFGDGQKPFFWIGTRGPAQSEIHVAFAADSRETVDAFYAAALEAGGTDNGGPGVREIYHPTYYGAYVLDPDGNNVEAVCHKPA